MTVKPTQQRAALTIHYCILCAVFYFIFYFGTLNLRFFLSFIRFYSVTCYDAD